MNTRSRKRFASRRGGALLFVMIAVGICVVLGLTYLGVAATSRSTSTLINSNQKARAAAEAGVEMSLAVMQKDQTWRVDLSEGAWITDYAFDGATFTVSLYDGYDEDDDGTLDGDADLTDNELDPVTIQSVGTYNDVQVSITVIYMPGSSSTVAAIEKIEIKDDAVVDSYNAAAGAYGVTNQGQNAVVTVNDVGKPNVKFEGGGTIDGDILFPPYADALTYAFEKNDGTITGEIGELSVDAVDMTIPDTPVLGGSASDETINAYEELSTDLYCNKLTIDGNGILKIIGDVTIVAEDTVEIKGEIRIENPSFGNTDESGSSEKNTEEIQIATPLTLAQEVEVGTIAVYTKKDGKKLRLAVYSDNSGTPGSLLVESDEVASTQNSFHWVEAVVPLTTLPAGNYWIAVAFDHEDSEYNYQSTSGGAGAETHTRSYDAEANGFLASWGTSDSVLNRTVSMVVTGNVDGMGGSLTIFAGGKEFKFREDCIVNANTQDPDRFKAYHVYEDIDGVLKAENDAIAYGTFHTLAGKLEMKDKAQLYGIGRVVDLKMDGGDCAFHADTSGGDASPGLVVDEYIEFKNGTIDAIDGGTAVLGCNSVGKAVIKVKDRATLKGSGYAGVGGAGGGTEVRVGSGASMTGTSGNLTEAVDISLPTTPVILPSIGDFKHSNNTTTINSSFTCNKIEIKGSAIIQVDGDVEIVATGDIIFQDTASIVLTTGSKLTIYCEKEVKLEKDIQLNVGGVPENFVIYAKKDKIEVKNKSQVAASIIAPNAEVKVKDETHWYGSIRAKKIKVEKKGQLHFNTSGSASVVWQERR